MTMKNRTNAPKLGPTDKHYRLAIKTVRKLGKGKKLRLLDIGAGSKIIERFLPESIKYDTMDFAEDFWEEAYTFNVNLDKEKFPIKDNTYDIILCHETLEHILYPEKVLKEIIRISKKNTVFLLSMPNEYNFIMRLYYLMGKKTKVDEPFKVVEKNLHIHKPRAQDIINLFAKYFKIEEVDYVWQSRMSESSSFSRTIDSLIQRLTKTNPGLFSRVVAVKCRNL